MTRSFLLGYYYLLIDTNVVYSDKVLWPATPISFLLVGLLIDETL